MTRLGKLGGGIRGMRRSGKLFARLFAVGLGAPKRTIACVVASVLLLGVSPTVTSWITKGLADNTLSFLQKPESYESVRLFVVFLLMIGVARSFSELLQESSRHFRLVLGRNLSIRMEDELIKKELTLPVEVYDDAQYLDKQAQTRSNAQGIPSQLLVTTLDLLQSGTTLLGSLVLLASVSLVLPLFGIVSALTSMASSGRIARNRYDLIHSRTQRVRREGYLRSLLGGKHNMIYNLLFGLLPFFTKEYEEYRGVTFREDIAESRFAALARVASQTAGTLLYLGAYAVAVYIVMKSGGTYGEVVMCTMLYSQTESSLQRIGMVVVSLYEQRLFMEDLFGVLDKGESRSWGTTVRGLPERVERICFENVFFRYPDCDNYVLNGVSFSLKRDEITCLVGVNGAGKTTIVNLLTRMYRPTSGTIRLNGIDLNDFAEDDLYGLFGVVTQILPSYYYSLRDNVRFGDLARSHTDEEHFRRSCEEYGVQHIAARLPRGYDTMLGRVFYGGEELSYGQWKSIAMARLAYKAAPVRVYDEPTAGLDPMAEQRLIEQIMGHRQEHITLVVSHAMAVAKDADHILLVREGRIMEQGSHSQLMGTTGVYSEMFSTQASRYVLDSPGP